MAGVWVWGVCAPRLRVLHELGEAERAVVLHVQEQQVVGGLLRRGVQEGHQQRHHLRQLPLRGRWRPRHGLVHGVCAQQPFERCPRFSEPASWSKLLRVARMLLCHTAAALIGPHVTTLPCAAL